MDWGGVFDEDCPSMMSAEHVGLSDESEANA